MWCLQNTFVISNVYLLSNIFNQARVKELSGIASLLDPRGLLQLLALEHGPMQRARYLQLSGSLGSQGAAAASASTGAAAAEQCAEWLLQQLTLPEAAWQQQQPLYARWEAVGKLAARAPAWWGWAAEFERGLSGEALQQWLQALGPEQQRRLLWLACCGTSWWPKTMGGKQWLRPPRASAPSSSEQQQEHSSAATARASSSGAGGGARPLGLVAATQLPQHEFQALQPLYSSCLPASLADLPEREVLQLLGAQAAALQGSLAPHLWLWRVLREQAQGSEVWAQQLATWRESLPAALGSGKAASFWRRLLKLHHEQAQQPRGGRGGAAAPAAPRGALARLTFVQAAQLHAAPGGGIWEALAATEPAFAAAFPHFETWQRARALLAEVSSWMEELEEGLHGKKLLQWLGGWRASAWQAFV